MTEALLLPPHSPELEQVILACLLDDLDRFRDLDDLQERDFYSDNNRAIYRALRGLYEDGEPSEFPLILARLGPDAERCTAPLGAAIGASRTYVWEPSAFMREMHLLRERRDAIAEASRLLREATEGRDFARCLRASVARLEVLAAELPGSGSSWRSAEEVAALELPDADERSYGFLPPGLIHLEPACLYGRGTLTVVAGRSGHGKSAYALQVTEGAAKAGEVVAYFSLEMPARELLYRMLARQFLDYTTIRRGHLTPRERQVLAGVQQRIATLPLYVHDKEGITVGEVLARSRELKRKEPALRLVVVDYLSLLDLEPGRGESRDIPPGRAAKALADLSRELDLAVLLVHQYGRGADKERPHLGHLADSDQIHRHAYSVVSIFNPEEGEAWIDVLKNRGGPKPSVRVLFDGPHQTFREAADQSRPEKAPTLPFRGGRNEERTSR
jgi:replicative DNA helicase